MAKKKANQQHVKIAAMQGNALDLSRFDSNSFDIVFLMGPLYHLAEEENRIQAIREATRVLKPGGCLFGNFLMMFGMIPFLLCHYPDQEAVLWPDVQEDLEDIAKGRNTVPMVSFCVYNIGIRCQEAV